MRRSSMSKKQSRKTFSNGVKRQHPKNRMSALYMRGGIRL